MDTVRTRAMRFWSTKDRRTMLEVSPILLTSISLIIGFHSEPKLATAIGSFFGLIALFWAATVHNQTHKECEGPKGKFDPYIHPIWMSVGGSWWHRMKENSVVMLLMLLNFFFTLVAYLVSFH